MFALTFIPSTPIARFGRIIFFGWVGLVALVATGLAASTSPFPTIVTAPAGRTVTVGQPVNFTVSVSGTAPFTFQWQRAVAGSDTFTPLTNGSDIAGATTATLSILSTTTAMSGDRFRALVGNALGTATSSAATLSVSKAVATVTLSGLAQIFSGEPKPVTVSTSPPGLTVNLTYYNSPTPPTNAGTYTVVATITDATRTGSKSGSLVIAKAPQTIFFATFSSSLKVGDAPLTLAATAHGHDFVT